MSMRSARWRKRSFSLAGVEAHGEPELRVGGALEAVGFGLRAVTAALLGHGGSKRSVDPTQAGIQSHRVFRDAAKKEYPRVGRVPALQAFEFHTLIVPAGIITALSSSL